jgi:non-specific serine/threonine protein kinase
VGDGGGVLACLAILVDAFAEGDQDETAVRLLGAIDAMRRQMDASAELIGGRNHDLLVAALRARLGSDAFIAAWESGKALPPDEAVRLAIAADREAAMIPLVALPVGELSPRQTEVVNLIAQGLSNKKIAEALFISERTADTHVEHILRKLGLHSRAQIAAWETERRANSALPGSGT